MFFDPKLNLFKSDAYIFMQQSRVKLQFEVVPKKHKFPHWDEVESLFKEDDWSDEQTDFA